MSCIIEASSASVEEIYELSFDQETNIYTCSQCSISFVDVDEHLKDYHYEEIDESSSTPQQIESDPQLLEPIKEECEEIEGIAIVMGNPEGKMTCEGCPKTFKSIKRFVEHLKTHGSDYQDKINALEGTQGMTADEKQQFCEQVICDNEPDKICYRCLECTTIFDTKKSFLLHYKIHTNRRALAAKKEKFPRGKLSCRVCNKTMSNQKLMDMHMKAHSENESHQSRKQYNPENQKKVPVDTSQIVNKLACQYCSKVFKRPVEKVKHERVHSGEKPFSCEICGKAFRVAYCLTLHKRSVHSDERPFVCTFNDCHKRFKSQSVYNHHLASHGSEKNFICPFCDKAFKTSVQLSGHKNTHTKPFSCSKCTRKFASLFAVKAHMETHKTSALKFKCLICSAAYGRTSALNEHMKLVHPEEIIDENFVFEEEQIE